MNDSTHLTAAISAFAAGVRSALDDLPADEVDELTDGLEADLLDQAADAGSEVFSPADPASYAAELRSAAGYPPRSTDSNKGGKSDAGSLSWTSMLASISERRRRIAADIRTRPGGAATLDLLVTLRPLWWVARGWVLAQVLVFVLGISPGLTLLPFGNPATTLVFAAAIVVSVQWGRGRWLPWRWTRGVKTLVSVGAIIALPVLAVTIGNVSYALSSDYAYSSTYAEVDPYATGLVSNGTQVTNIFVYDAEGNPVENAQLFTQDGAPLTPVSTEQTENFLSVFDPETGEEAFLVPSDAVPGGKGWNVFPLAGVDAQLLYQEDDWEAVAPTLPRETVPAPFAKVRPLATDQEGSPKSSSSPTPATGAPSDPPQTSGATPESTLKPIPTPTATPTPTKEPKDSKAKSAED